MEFDELFSFISLSFKLKNRCLCQYQRRFTLIRFFTWALRRHSVSFEINKKPPLLPWSKKKSRKKKLSPNVIRNGVSIFIFLFAKHQMAKIISFEGTYCWTELIENEVKFVSIEFQRETKRTSWHYRKKVTFYWRKVTQSIEDHQKYHFHISNCNKNSV